MADATNSTVLKVTDLHTYFYTELGVVRAVDGVSFELARARALGVVGESGCGKTALALSILRLIPYPPGKIVSGEICLKGQKLLDFSEEQMEKVRGRDVAMIFQEPMTSLNPVFTVGSQLNEVFILHQGLRHKEARLRSKEMLDMVRVPDSGEILRAYPHQLSGGMRQRVMIAMALACQPTVLVADEPTTALDVTIQAQILELLENLQEERATSLMLITHNLGVVARLTQGGMVMYAGRVMEYCSTKSLFKNPLHPYTKSLFRCTPRMGIRKKRLDVIPGTVPGLTEEVPGCYFAGRCSEEESECTKRAPSLVEVEPGRWVSCLKMEERG